jgi:hypothetical protein
MTETNSAFWWTLLKDEGLGLGGALLRGTFSGLGLGLPGGFCGVPPLPLARVAAEVGRRCPQSPRLVLAVLCLPLAFAFVGFHQGVVRAAHRLTTTGPFAREVLPGAAAGIADFVFLLDARMGGLLGETIDEERETLDVARFLDRKTRLEEQVLEKILPQLAAEVKTKHPILREGAGAKLIDVFVLRFGED